jgi:type II secretory pathway component PulF
MTSSEPIRLPALLAEWSARSLWAIPLFLIVVVVLLFAAFVLHLLLGAPAARRERARFFLHLLACGMDQGKSPERTASEIARTRTLDLGARFHLVASYLASGLKLSEALAKVPRFLPPTIRAMLQIGEELGDVRKVIPGCRLILQREVLGQEAVFFMPLVMMSVVLPVAVAWLILFQVVIRPKFTEMFGGLSDAGGSAGQAWAAWQGLHYWGPVAVAGLFVVWLFVCGTGLAIVAGPRINERFGLDRFTWLFPWVRHRCRRDFAAMLSVLLDAGVDERRALELAAGATGHSVFIRRAVRAEATLVGGAGLPQAIEQLEGRGEFSWRMNNALRSGGGFLEAVAGWVTALEMRAERAERAAATAIGVGAVLFQGLVVGVMVVSVFGLLIGLVETYL